MEYTIHTDGGARGNPGPAGIGFVISDESGKIVKKVGAYVGVQTNNWAEYEALIYALTELKKIIPKEKREQVRVDVRMDSELVVKQLNGEYQIKEESMQKQFIRVWNLRVGEFPNINFSHIPREKNKEADLLYNKALDAHESR
jgi:ribonuclease HI